MNSSPLESFVHEDSPGKKLPCPPPGDLPNLGIEPRPLALWVDSLLPEPRGKAEETGNCKVISGDQVSTGPRAAVRDGGGFQVWPRGWAGWAQELKEESLDAFP